MDLILWLVLVFVLAFIPAAIAKSKGHGALEWWLFGLFLFIVALPCALFLRPVPGFAEAQQRASGMKKCPACAEMVQGEALKCRYCGTIFGASNAPRLFAEPTAADTVLANNPHLARKAVGPALFVLLLAYLYLLLVRSP